MATFALPGFRQATALTQNEFESRWEYPTATSAALTKPIEHSFLFQSKGNDYGIRVTTNGATAPAWVEPAISAIIEVQALPENWDSYGGRKTNRDLIIQSLSVLELIMEVATPAPSVVPLGDGGLQLEWHRKQQDLEIAFPADDTPQYYYQNRASGVEQEGFASDVLNLAQLLRNIA
jgi:hypothetical protein